jgi:ribosomal protein S27E
MKRFTIICNKCGMELDLKGKGGSVTPQSEIWIVREDYQKGYSPFVLVECKGCKAKEILLKRKKEVEK